MRFPDNPDPAKITLALSFSMVLIYLGLGYLFIATNTWVDRFPRPNRVYIGLVFVGWATFRSITIWLKYKRLKNEDEDE